MDFCSLVSSDGVFTITVGGSSSGQASKTKTKSSSVNVPSQRMKPGLTICKGNLYLFGGEYENGSKQYTLNDFYSLGIDFYSRILSIFFYVSTSFEKLKFLKFSSDLHKLDEWKTIIKQDLGACEWMESDSEESGSDSGSDEDDDDDDEDDDDSDDSSEMDTD